MRNTVSITFAIYLYINTSIKSPHDNEVGVFSFTFTMLIIILLCTNFRANGHGDAPSKGADFTLTEHHYV